jgi:hypothetical protein
MVANAVAGYATDAGRHAIVQDLVITVAINLWLGQFALAAIIGGLVGRTWLSGWLIAVLLATVCFAISLAADNICLY